MTLSKLWVLSFAATILVFAGSSCRRNAMQVVGIDVPDMDSERAVRIIANSVANEVVGQFDGRKKEYKADLQNGFFYYYEGPVLKDAAYRQSIVGSIRDVGFEAEVLHAWHCPPPPVNVNNHPEPVQMWGNRHALLLRIPAMRTAVDANRIVGAIAHARTGGNMHGISVDRETRCLTVHFDAMRTQLTNMEHAVACCGYRANDIPASFGAADAIPWCWDATTANLTRKTR